MTREQNIFETNNYDGGLLVDRNTNLPVGFTSRGVDQNFVTASTDPVTGRKTISVDSITTSSGDLFVTAPTPNTVWIIGDSLAANSYVTTGSPVTFMSRGSEGWFNWLDAYLGAPFTVLGSSASGGKTTAQISLNQLPLLIASSAKYCVLSAGINDINVSLVSGEVCAASIISLIRQIQSVGVTPIWSTLFPQSYDSVVTPKVIKCNDILRQFAANNNSGLFFDGYITRVDPSNSQNPSRGASHSYDATAYLHPNNLGAMQVGIMAGEKLKPMIALHSYMQAGNEDVTYNSGSNLLSNPGFSAGTAGTVSANCTGTMPTGWVISWGTRTGTGSAAAAIVDISDSVTGLVIAKAIQVTISGSCASGDSISISQSDTQNALLKNNLIGGNFVQSECVAFGANCANLNRFSVKAQTNSTESAWFGSNTQTPVSYPTTIPKMSMVTAKLLVLGSGIPSQAKWEAVFTFNGAGTGTVLTVYNPRFRKI